MSVEKSEKMELNSKEGVQEALVRKKEELHALIEEVNRHNIEQAPRLEEAAMKILGGDDNEGVLNFMKERGLVDSDARTVDKEDLQGVKVGFTEGFMGAGRKLRLLAELVNKDPAMVELRRMEGRSRELESEIEGLEGLLKAYETVDKVS